MTNSAFVHLIYNLSKQNEDELKMPVLVKNLDSTKVVFIEKPYIAKNLNQRDKNEKFYKRSLMVSLIKNQILTRNSSKKLTNSCPSDRTELKPADSNSADYETENKLVSY